MEMRIRDNILTASAYDGNIIKITVQKADDTGEKPSALKIMPPGKPVSSVIEDKDKITMSTEDFSLNVDRKSGRMNWLNKSGSLLVSQPFPEIYRQEVIRYSTGGEQPVIRRVKTVDGERNFVENLKPYHDRDAYRAKVWFDFAESEAIHGLGQLEEGAYNRRGETRYLYQHNMRIPVPFFVSANGYGVLFNCGALMTFNDGADGVYFFLDTVDALEYYFIRGEKLDDIIKGFRRLTGAAGMLPKWAFGYIQSKEAYNTQQELVETAGEYRRRHIPLDCVVQDWNTWVPGLWGDKHPDKSRYPDLAAANRELHAMNVHSMISVWPNMNTGGGDYQELFDAGKLLGDNATYDAFDGQAREIYWRQMERELFSGGFDSWWCDSTEPFSGPDWGGEALREPWERFTLVGNEHKRYLDPALANLFALQHARGIYENQRRAAPGKRVLNLTRSGSAGIQQYGAVLWSGDICATWKVMRRQIAEGLNLCMSGLPWWTLDIGGFFTVKNKWQNRGCGNNQNPNPLWFWQGDFEDGVNDLGYRELYVRWLQMGAFLPMFRSHGTDTPREIWRFGEKGGMFYDAIEKYIRLRYRLMPTIYSTAGNAALNGGAMMRSLLFDFAHDDVAKQIDDAFMLGNFILINPVTEPMYYLPESKPIDSPKIRRCYLPSGCGWHNFYTGERFDGGQWLDAAAELDAMPVFVRDGGILVMEMAALEYACEVTDEPLLIQIYGGADGRHTLYEDSGDGYNYESGEYNQIALEWNDRKKILSIGAAKYKFPQSMNGRVCVARVGEVEKKFSYNGESLKIML